MRSDITAGLTVAAMLVPQAMAYALLADLPPAIGLAASGLPLIAYAIAGHSPRVAMGPAAIDSLLTAAALHSLDVDPDQRIAAAAILAALIGTIHVLAATAGVSRLVRHLSVSSLHGFTAGAAILIALSQVKNLTGAPIDTASSGPGRMLNTIAAIDQVDPATLAISVLSIGLLVSLRRWTPIPSALGAVGVMTAVSFAMGNPSPTVGAVPAVWPTLAADQFEATLALRLLPIALVIAVVGFMEMLAVTNNDEPTAPTAPAGHPEPRRELLGLGLANITSGLAGGMPVTAGLSRSAVNAQAGAETRRAGAVTAAAVMITAALFTPLIASLPRATLAAIVLVAVTLMIDWRDAFGRLAHAAHWPFTITFATTVLLGATAGIVCTLGTSLVIWMIGRTTSRTTNRLHTLPKPHNVRTNSRLSEPAALPKEPVMHFAQYYLDCLSQASYLIGDTTTGRAVIVDPRRDIGEYIADANELGLSIELVLETHFHADFLSGHLEIAEATGAEIAFSAVAETAFASRKLADGERISLGQVQLEIRHTPGHTPESMSIVVWEHADDEAPWGVLTGDTMFIGDVGRPDLLSSIGFSRDDLASQLYDSIQTQLLTLPDATRVWPGHGAGSSCGKNLSSETSSTIGAQREANYALQTPDKASFIDLVTTGQPVAPGYFAYDAMLNRQERGLLDEFAPLPTLSPTELQAAIDAGAALLDTRGPDAFAIAHVPGSINVGLGGRYAEFAGAVLATDVDIILVVDDAQALEARNRLARIGYDRVIGAVESSADVLSASAERLTAAEYAAEALAGTTQLVDVRNPGETEGGVIDGAIEIPVVQLVDRIAELDPAKRTVVYCAGGYRSSVAASVLRSAGFNDVADIDGGWAAWSDRATAPA